MPAQKKKEFLVKYLEENLIFNRNGEVWAYYEWLPYNYNFISEDKAIGVFEGIKQVLEASQADKYHMLMIGAEESIHEQAERSKKDIKGDLKDLAYKHVEGWEEHLKNIYGEYVVGYRYYIGFRLSADAIELSAKNVIEELRNGMKDFLQSANRVVFGDYEIFSNREIERYLKIESLLHHRISKGFGMRKVKPKDIAYIIQHLNGHTGEAYDTFDYQPEVKVSRKSTEVKKHDIYRLANSRIRVGGRSLTLETEDRRQKVAYLTLSKITEENVYPFGAEVFYYEQEAFDFPVDVSMQVETVENRKALQNLRSEKRKLKDLDESAMESGNETSQNLLKNRDDADELETRLDQTKEDMYKISYVIRVSAKDDETLAKRISEVKDFYRTYHMLVERPLGDQLGLHEEFYPSSKRYIDDYVQYVRSDFIAGLGFGATRKLGEKEGIYVGREKYTGLPVYMKPWTAAQGLKGTVTNALSKAFIGSLGGGKSVTMNLLAYYSVLYGGKAFIIDPKGERSNWTKDLPQLGDELNIIDISANEENQGILDPFVIMKKVIDAEGLALNILTYLTGIKTRDGERFPVLREHVKKVASYPEGKPRGLLCVIDELRKTNTEISNSIANHVESFKDLSIAGLIFGNGKPKRTLKADKAMNVVLIQDLVLPDRETPVENHTTMEILSIASLLVLSTYSLDFIKMDRSVFKLVLLDEAWSWLQVTQGKALSNRLIREGRSMKAAIDFGTQNCDDLAGEKMKNNIGMKFVFRSQDKEEIRKSLEFLNLEYTEENIKQIQSLENGECLYQDIYGHCGVIYVDYVFLDLFRAFDTRPPIAA